MVWHLRFDSNDDQAVPAVTVRNSGLGTTAWTFEFKGVVRTLPTTGDVVGILGSTLSSTSTGFCITSTGEFAVFNTGSALAFSPTAFFIVNELHTYRVERLSGGTVEFRRDGSLISSTTYSGGADFISSRELNRFGKCRSGTTSSAIIDIEYITATGFTNGQTWNANLSGGTGSLLPTVSGGNQATLFGTPSWVEYSPAGGSKPLKYWNGSAWVVKPLKYWNGSAWVVKPLKYHNGTSWS